MAKRLEFFKIWLVIYGIGLVLIPPLHIKEKTIYAAEILLLPLLFMVALEIARGNWRPPPKTLIWLSGALFVAYGAGLLRGNKALDFSRYWGFHEDAFTFTQDTTRFIRLLLIFCTPWLLSYFSAKKESASKLFFNTVKWCLALSAALALLENAGYISLREMYHPDKFAFFWAGRSYATFASPLEASLMFTAVLIQSVSQINKSKLAQELGFLLLLGLGLLLTEGGTGLVASTAGLFYILFQKVPPKRRIPFLAIAAAVLTILFWLTPDQFLLVKTGNFEFRTRTWIKWLHALPSYPHFLLIGMGFTNLVIDNSLLGILVMGGINLLIPFYYWMKNLFLKIPRIWYPFFLVWGISWLTLDSLTYWGIGRVAWILLGLVNLEYPRKA